MENEILELAKEIEFNAKAEAQAIYDYTEMIRKTLASNIDDEKKVDIINVISEIVSDELNHELRLRELYTFLTGIETNKD